MGKNQNKFIWLKGRFYHQQQMVNPQIREELNYIIQIEQYLYQYNQWLKHKIKSTYSLSQTHPLQWDKIARQNYAQISSYYQYVLRRLIFYLPQKHLIDSETKDKLKQNSSKLSIKLDEFATYIFEVLLGISISTMTSKKSQKIVWVDKDFPLEPNEINVVAIMFKKFMHDWYRKRKSS